MQIESIDILLDEIIEKYRCEPVDLLDIDDGQGEYNYILNAKKSYKRTLKDIISLVSRDVENTRILEIGSYLGVISIALSRLHYKVTAADLPDYMGNSRLQEKYRQDSVMSYSLNLSNCVIPSDSASFEIVIMCETLEHLNFNPIPVLIEINRVLVNGGYLYISLPNLASLINRAKLLTGQSIHNPIRDFSAQLAQNSNMIVGIHWREYTKTELLELLDLSGFAATRHYYFTSTASHPLAKLLYALFPSLKPNQTAIAIKNRSEPLTPFSGRQPISVDE